MSLALLLVAGASVGTTVAAQTVASVDVLPGGPNFTRPTWVGAAPGDTTRLFVVEKQGFIKIIKNGAVLGTPFLDIDAVVNSVANERGLLSMAFHPNYASNGKFYVAYTDAAGLGVVREYLVSGNPDLANSASFTTLYTAAAHPQSNHNGGCLGFGADGKLYYSQGDGGNFNDQGTGHVAGGNAQSLSTDLGKLLRMDVDSVPPGLAAGNPTLGGYKWAYGLRNLWRFSFDRSTGDLWMADVGQDAWEEIDFAPASSTGGENYGWRCMEGANCTGLSGCTCDLSGATLRLPIQQYQHTGGNCSITGGYVYRGSAISGLAGTYFYSDYCTGRTWSLKWNGTSVTDFQERTSQLGTFGNPTSYGQDANGELYVCGDNGRVRKIVSNEPGVGFCFGDGSLPTACPCVPPNTVPNPSGAPDAGCANSFNLDGASLAASGATSPTDTVVLTGSGLTPSGFALFIVGDTSNPNGTANGDGVICVTGSLTRFGSQNASGGVVQYPNTNPGQGIALSIVSGTTPGSGATRNYQIFYRNSVAGFCNAATSNVSSAYRIVW